MGMGVFLLFVGGMGFEMDEGGRGLIPFANKVIRENTLCIVSA